MSSATPAQKPIPDDTVVTLQRGNCEGGCPEYRVVIFATGDVLFQGIIRVARRGVVLTQIDPDQLRNLLAEFDSAKYFELENIYGFRGKGCPPTDVGKSMIITSLSSGGRSRTISHYSGCTGGVGDQLTAIERHIDQIARTARWINKGMPARR
jgi:hypothetical protein